MHACADVKPDTAMLSGMWLHPLHADDNMPVFPIHMQKQLTDLHALAAFAAQLAGYHGAAASSAITRQVFLGLDGMIICSGNEVSNESSRSSALQVSLRFSEVVLLREVSQKQLIAVGRRETLCQSDDSTQGACRLDGPFGELWVLVTDSDEAVLCKLLDAMGTLGAIRTDFRETYEIVKSIGNGGCATVYLASHIRSEAEISLPAILATVHDSRPHYVAAKIIERSHKRHITELVTAEAAFLIAMQRHPNIIAFYGIFTMPDEADAALIRWVMALEWCCKGDLHDRLIKLGAYGEAHAAGLTVGLLAALAHVHSQGIVHRDVKAENILLGQQGRPVLSDFGIAARLDDEESMQQRCGSPGYAAPEVLNGQKYDGKVDVFGSGVLLYFMVSSSLPFMGKDVCSMWRRTVRCRVKFDAEAFLSVSKPLKRFILSLLQKDAADRPKACRALRSLWNGWRVELLEQSHWLRGIEHRVLGETAQEVNDPSSDPAQQKGLPPSLVTSSSRVSGNASLGMSLSPILSTHSGRSSLKDVPAVPSIMSAAAAAAAAAPVSSTGSHRVTSTMIAAAAAATKGVAAAAAAAAKCADDTKDPRSRLTKTSVAAAAAAADAARFSKEESATAPSTDSIKAEQDKAKKAGVDHEQDAQGLLMSAMLKWGRRSHRAETECTSTTATSEKYHSCGKDDRPTQDDTYSERLTDWDSRYERSTWGDRESRSKDSSVLAAGNARGSLEETCGQQHTVDPCYESESYDFFESDCSVRPPIYPAPVCIRRLGPVIGVASETAERPCLPTSGEEASQSSSATEATGSLHNTRKKEDVFRDQQPPSPNQNKADDIMHNELSEAHMPEPSVNIRQQPRYEPRAPATPRMTDRVQRYIFRRKDVGGNSTKQMAKFTPLASRRCGAAVNQRATNAGSGEEERPSFSERPSFAERISKLSSRGWHTFCSDDSEVESPRHSMNDVFDSTFNRDPKSSFDEKTSEGDQQPRFSSLMDDIAQKMLESDFDDQMPAVQPRPKPSTTVRSSIRKSGGILGRFSFNKGSESGTSGSGARPAAQRVSFSHTERLTFSDDESQSSRMTFPPCKKMEASPLLSDDDTCLDLEAPRESSGSGDAILGESAFDSSKVPLMPVPPPNVNPQNQNSKWFSLGRTLRRTRSGCASSASSVTPTPSALTAKAQVEPALGIK